MDNGVGICHFKSHGGWRWIREVFGSIVTGFRLFLLLNMTISQLVSTMMIDSLCSYVFDTSFMRTSWGIANGARVALPSMVPNCSVPQSKGELSGSLKSSLSCPRLGIYQFYFTHGESPMGLAFALPSMVPNRSVPQSKGELSGSLKSSVERVHAS